MQGGTGGSATVLVAFGLVVAGLGFPANAMDPPESGSAITEPCELRGSAPHTGCKRWATKDRPARDGNFSQAVTSEAAPELGLILLGGQTGGASRFSPEADATVWAIEAATGAIAWTTRLDVIPDRWDEIFDVAYAPETGLVAVTGHQNTETAADDVLAAVLDARTGQVLWADHRPIVDGAREAGVAVEFGLDGERLFVAANGWIDGENNVLTVAFDAHSGATRWSRLVEASDDPCTGCLAVGPTGRVLVAADGLAPIVVGLRGEDGIVLYVAQAGSKLSGLSDPGGLSLHPNGSLAIVVGEWIGISGPMYAVAFDTGNGTVQWATRIRGDGFLTSVTFGPDGDRVFVGGGTERRAVGVPAGLGSADVLTFPGLVVALDAENGTVDWRTPYGGTGPQGDLVDTLAMNPAGTRVLAGIRAGDGFATNLAVAAYNATTGDRAWSARYERGVQSQEIAWGGLTVAPNAGLAVVAGQTDDLAGQRGDLREDVDMLAVGFPLDPAPTAGLPGPERFADR